MDLVHSNVGGERHRPVSRQNERVEPPRLLLAPGASGTVESLGPMLRGLAARGVDASGVTLPRGSAERALPAWRAAIAGADVAAIAIGGQSFGGRVASLLAAEEPRIRALVLLCFPLHPPGRPERAEERAAHLERIRCPVLFLSGEADPFARLPLLRTAAARVPNAELVTYPRVGHSLTRVLDDALDRIAAFVRRGTDTCGRRSSRSPAPRSTGISLRRPPPSAAPAASEPRRPNGGAARGGDG